jgi:quercetin dioxygenase-like cupin family protein
VYFEEDTVQQQIRSAAFAVAVAAVAGIMIVAAWAPRSASAQQQPDGVERKILMHQDLSIPGWESVMIQTTMQPGGTEGWHTHPGTLVEYILQGPWTMERRGKPTVTYQTGDTFSITAGEIHQAINPGKTAVRGLAILIVDKSKPMTTQVK